MCTLLIKNLFFYQICSTPENVFCRKLLAHFESQKKHVTYTQGPAHGGRRWAVPTSSQWLPPCTDLPQSSLMHAWKTYLTDNLPNCHLLRHDLYPIIIKMIIIFT